MDILTLAATLTISSGGSTAVSKSIQLADKQINGFTESGVIVPASGSRFIAANGVDITGQTDPVLPGFTDLGGIIVVADQPIGIKVDGAAVAIPHEAGAPFIVASTFQSFEIENQGATPAKIDYVVWGQLNA